MTELSLVNLLAWQERTLNRMFYLLVSELPTSQLSYCTWASFATAIWCKHAICNGSAHSRDFAKSGGGGGGINQQTVVINPVGDMSVFWGWVWLAQFQRIPKSWPHSLELFCQITCRALLVMFGKCFKKVLNLLMLSEDKQQCSLSQEAICWCFQLWYENILFANLCVALMRWPNY